MDYTGICLYCNEPLRGRADKKFCDDQCRNNYNNQRKNTTNPYVRHISQILHRNRRILEKLLRGQVSHIRIEKALLGSSGFNFLYYTHQLSPVADQPAVRFCYEFGYCILGQEVILVKQESLLPGLEEEIKLFENKGKDSS
jgi:predicted nucleic acid-binding Zn ribbon protein